MAAVSFLISDPSSALQAFFQQLLGSHGFDAAAIKTAASPHGAAEMAASHKPDLLITDWFAKESLTGLELHRQVLQVSPSCKLALMAQTTDPEHEQHAQAAGALFLLKKPFSADMARSAVARALKEIGAVQPPRPAPIQLPRLPSFRPGDTVMYRNRTERVQHVILRRGEMVIQLEGIPGMIEANRIQPL